MSSSSKFPRTIEVMIEHLDPNPFQPRLTIDDRELEGLVKSIREFGFTNSLEARPDPHRPGRYQLVYGHRRVRAAYLAGLKTVPVQIVERSDLDMMGLALKENVDRKNLTYFEEAIGIQQVMEARNWTYEAMAEWLGKKKTYVFHRLEAWKVVEEQPDSALALAVQNASIDLTSVVTLRLLQKRLSPDEYARYAKQAIAGECSAKDLKERLARLRQPAAISERVAEPEDDIHRKPQNDFADQRQAAPRAEDRETDGRTEPPRTRSIGAPEAISGSSAPLSTENAHLDHVAAHPTEMINESGDFKSVADAVPRSQQDLAALVTNNLRELVANVPNLNRETVQEENLAALLVQWHRAVKVMDKVQNPTPLRIKQRRWRGAHG